MKILLILLKLVIGATTFFVGLINSMEIGDQLLRFLNELNTFKLVSIKSCELFFVIVGTNCSIISESLLITFSAFLDVFFVCET